MTDRVDDAPEESASMLSPTVAVAGHMVGDQSLGGVTMEEVIAFGGIPDPASGGGRFSHRIQSQLDADDIQMGRATRAAKL